VRAARLRTGYAYRQAGHIRWRNNNQYGGCLSGAASSTEASACPEGTYRWRPDSLSEMQAQVTELQRLLAELEGAIQDHLQRGHE